MRTTRRPLGEGAFGPEPAHDPQLGALLRQEVGTPPVDAVDWNALAQRISARVAAHVATPWWRYAMRWEKRLLPIAVAAGLAGAVSIWATQAAASQQTTTASAATTAVAAGTPAEDAALLFAHSVTRAAEITVGAPE